jgi:hypothetical protein
VREKHRSGSGKQLNDYAGLLLLNYSLSLLYDCPEVVAR